MQFDLSYDGNADASFKKACQAELDYVIGDPSFPASARRKQLLEYLVQETLAGRGDQLTAVPIAQAVFKRDSTFDHQSDPVVRVEARRLRQDLDRYYAGAGKERPLRITIPKGGYAVRFVPQAYHASLAKPPESRAIADYLSARFVAIFAIILASAFVIAVTWQKYVSEKEVPASISIKDDDTRQLQQGPALAIVPFFDLSGSADRQHIADGITQQLATELSRFEQLRVLPLGTLQRYKNIIADPGKIEAEFGAAYVLEGSVRVNAELIRITARLIDTANSQYVWAKDFSESFTPANVYDVQDAIAQEVAANIAGKYGFVAQANTAQSKRKAPDSLEAYDCVLRYYEYQSSINPASHPTVKACLEDAVAIEPDYAEAWAVLANIYMQEVRFGYGSDARPETSVTAAKRAATRALEINPQSTTGNIVMGNLLFTEGNLRQFREMAERALIDNPNDSDVMVHFGLRLAISGDWERGLELIDKAVALNPAFPTWYRFARVFYDYYEGEYELALEEIDKITMPNFFWKHLIKAAALGQLGRQEEALLAKNKLLSLQEDFPTQGRSLIKAWHFQEKLYDSIIEGLNKAGLQLEEQEV